MEPICHPPTTDHGNLSYFCNREQCVVRVMRITSENVWPSHDRKVSSSD